MYNFPEIVMKNGEACFKRVTQRTTESGLMTDIGNSYQMTVNALKKFYYEMTEKGAGWVVWETFVFRKNVKKSAELFCELIFNSDVVQGHTHFHNSKYRWPTIVDGYINIKQQLNVQIHCDGGPMKNKPKQYSSMTVSWLKFDFFNNGLSNSIYAGFPIMFSALTEDNNDVIELFDSIMETLGPSGTFEFDCTSLNCKVRVPWKLTFCGDLKIRNKWCNRCVAVGGDYGIPQAVKISVQNDEKQPLITGMHYMFYIKVHKQLENRLQILYQ